MYITRGEMAERRGRMRGGQEVLRRQALMLRVERAKTRVRCFACLIMITWELRGYTC
jgi:hypothetical protein